MRRSPSYLVAVLVSTSATWAYAAGGSTPFAPFDQFVNGVGAATFSALQASPQTRIRDAQAFEEMRQHVLSLYQGVHVTHSFTTDSQVFDCVPLMEQPSVRQLGLTQIATPPTPIQPAGQDGSSLASKPVSPLQLGLVDPFGNAIHCDSGTIPMRRVTLDELSRFETLRQFFDKGPNGAGRPGPSTYSGTAAHKYSHAYQFVNNYGGSSYLNLWNPLVNTGATQVFSLSQHWYVGGSGSSLQTAEGGWQVYPGKYGTSNAVTFIYWTRDGYTSTGCYNLDCTGFVQTNSNWHLGGTWSNYSTVGGTQYEFHLQYQYSSGNWWLFLQGSGTLDAVGYYPGSIYNGGQMSQYATEIDYGGETVGTTSWPYMGSGQWASTGWSYAAYQRNIFYIDTSGATQWSSLNQSPSTCYSMSYTPSSSGGSWGTYFYFGGPGGTGC